MPQAVAHSKLEDGLIVPPTGLELIAVDHCNISCKSCNHASPVLSKWSADPDDVYRDMSILAKVYRPRYVKVLGGEPLLYPRLFELIRAVRASGICDRVLVLTNGVLLNRMTDALWREIDEVEVSVYAEAHPGEENLVQAQMSARRFDTKLTINVYNSFRPTFTTAGTNDTALIRKLYSACKIANLWGSHGVYRGHFYKCPQSIYVPKLVEEVPEVERVEVRDAKGFQAELLAFVNSPTPLASCKHCVGTVGKQEKHSLVARRQWKTFIAQPTEQMIDYDLLEHSLVSKDWHDDCKTDTDLGWAPPAPPRWRRLLRRYFPGTARSSREPRDSLEKH